MKILLIFAGILFLIIILTILFKLTIQCLTDNKKSTYENTNSPTLWQWTTTPGRQQRRTPRYRDCFRFRCYFNYLFNRWKYIFMSHKSSRANFGIIVCFLIGFVALIILVITLSEWTTVLKLIVHIAVNRIVPGVTHYIALIAENQPWSPLFRSKIITKKFNIMNFIFAVLIVLAAIFVICLIRRGFKNMVIMLKNEKDIYLKARNEKKTILKVLILSIAILSLTGCGTSNGLHGKKYVYHNPHNNSHSVNSNGLYK